MPCEHDTLVQLLQLLCSGKMSGSCCLLLQGMLYTQCCNISLLLILTIRLSCCPTAFSAIASMFPRQMVRLDHTTVSSCAESCSLRYQQTICPRTRSSHHE